MHHGMDCIKPAQFLAVEKSFMKTNMFAVTMQILHISTINSLNHSMKTL